jgi:hypothetical protein
VFLEDHAGRGEQAITPLLLGNQHFVSVYKTSDAEVGVALHHALHSNTGQRLLSPPPPIQLLPYVLIVAYFAWRVLDSAA